MPSKKVIVYAVESGSYSDYRVHALFAHKADAEKAAKLLYGGHLEDGEVVTREVYQELPAPTTYYWIERMNGKEPSDLREHIVQDWDGPMWTGRMVRGVAFSKWQYGVRVWGTDKEGVRRRWQEYTQQEEAERAGV